MWKVKTEVGYYTITYCPMCKVQRCFHTIDYNVYQCGVCELKMTYNYKKNRLVL